MRRAKECTQKCVQLGGKYVLFDPATKAAYQLDNQEKAAAFARSLDLVATFCAIRRRAARNGPANRLGTGDFKINQS